jgi:hypothetical protein
MACPALFSSFFPSKNLMHSKTSEQQHGILKKKKKTATRRSEFPWINFPVDQNDHPVSSDL